VSGGVTRLLCQQSQPSILRGDCVSHDSTESSASVVSVLRLGITPLGHTQTELHITPPVGCANFPIWIPGFVGITTDTPLWVIPDSGCASADSPHNSRRFERVGQKRGLRVLTNPSRLSPRAELLRWLPQRNPRDFQIVIPRGMSIVFVLHSLAPLSGQFRCLPGEPHEAQLGVQVG
jgi:hypothetical protein